MKWWERFQQARRSGTRGAIFVFNTTDYVFMPEAGVSPCRLKFFLAQVLHQEGYTVWGLSLGQGLYRLSPGNQQRIDVPDPRNIELVLRELTGWLRQGSPRKALIVDYADHLAPNSQGMTAVLSPLHMQALQTLHSWGTDDAIRLTDNLVLLLSHENQLHDLLVKAGSGYLLLQVELPDMEQRLAFTRFLLDRRHGTLVADLDVDEFARITGGLRLADIEEVLRLGRAEGNGAGRQQVRDKKAATIRQLGRDLVEVIEPKGGFESVAGLRHAIEYFELLRWRMLKGARDVPLAILLAGVPGCGKSWLVPVLGKELGCPVLRMGNVRERWVGASERNLDHVLWIAETLSPCIVMIDEIDQALGGQRTTGPSSDAGTSERMMARIWEFMGSMRHRGQILWIATTNRPDLLDAATVDRFQIVIPFLHPTRAEIRGLLPLLANQLGRVLADAVDVEEIAGMPSLRLPTVRALQEVVGTAGALADYAAGIVGVPIGNDHLLRAAAELKPNHDPLVHEFIALTAIGMTKFKFLLPWRGLGGLRSGFEVPPYLGGIVDQQREVDEVALRRRLAELRSQIRV